MTKLLSVARLDPVHHLVLLRESASNKILFSKPDLLLVIGIKPFYQLSSPTALIMIA